MTKREELFKSMIVKFHGAENYLMCEEDVDNYITIANCNYGRVYRSFEEAFDDYWSNDIVEYYFNNFVKFGDIQFFGYDFTDEEFKFLEEYIKDNNLGNIY